MSTCLVKPESGVGVLSFLEREGKLIDSEKISELSWDEIDKTEMPVCYIKTPQGHYAYVCHNKDQFYLYKKQTLDVSDGNERSFYFVKIHTLIKNSSLPAFKHEIAKDRIHEKIDVRMHLDPRIEEELLMDIVTSLNRTKTAKQIAANFGVPLSVVQGRRKKLEEGGVQIPKGVSGNTVSMFLQKIKQTNPAVFGLTPKAPEPIKKKLGRPKKY